LGKEIDIDWCDFAGASAKRPPIFKARRLGKK